MVEHTTAVVLAGGLGTRMRSPLAKVLHSLAGRTMVGWGVHALRPLAGQVVVVVHHQEDAVRAALKDVQFARQETPRGTGDALASALALLPPTGPVLVVPGDAPLLRTETLQRLLAGHKGRCTVGSMIVDEPGAYGRIVREGGTRIVEAAECSAAERAIREVNTGVYVFEASYLHAALPALQPHPPKGEYYLTDLVVEDAQVVELPEAECLGINDRAALAEARAILRRRINRAWALMGVDFADLDAALIDAEVVLEPDAHIGYGAVIEGKSHIAGHVGAHCVLKDTFVAANSRVLPGTVCEGARIGPGCTVGPMARLRPGAHLTERVKVGNFVEVKNAVLHPAAQASHLSYLGDAEVGAGANIGAGTITCNYDGVRKNRTYIGAGAFIGSNTALVAPVSVGDRAIIGAGSTITADVPEDAIAVTRAPMRQTLRSADRLRQRYRALAGKDSV